MINLTERQQFLIRRTLTMRMAVLSELIPKLELLSTTNDYTKELEEIETLYSEMINENVKS